MRQPRYIYQDVHWPRGSSKYTPTPGPGHQSINYPSTPQNASVEYKHSSHVEVVFKIARFPSRQTISFIWRMSLCLLTGSSGITDRTEVITACDGGSGLNAAGLILMRTVPFQLVGLACYGKEGGKVSPGGSARSSNCPGSTPYRAALALSHRTASLQSSRQAGKGQP
jgi:hypothetical protein